MDATGRHLAVIRRLFGEAERRGILLWFESGWAIDARLGRCTRAHGDIDVAYPKEQEEAYLELLRHLGFGPPERESYGFLSWKEDVLLDSEPCFRIGGAYGFPGFPGGSCPMEKEGLLGGLAVRCLSWEAMYSELLGYMREVPGEQWRAKDFESLRVVEAHVSVGARRRLRRDAGMRPAADAAAAADAAIAGSRLRTDSAPYQRPVAAPPASSSDG